MDPQQVARVAEPGVVRITNTTIRSLGAAALVCTLAASGCRNRDEGISPLATRAPGSVAEADTASFDETNVAAHDPAHPPIDCPLKKQGVDATHMRPFDDVEKYIAFLDRADRTAWQKPDDVVAALSLRGNETVFDLGAGSGYFTFRLAKVLPQGKVVAADTEPEMIRHIHHQAMSEGAANIQVAVIKPDDPLIPADADLVFVCDVLHHVSNRSAWLGKLVSEMKTGARLVLIEFKEGKLPEGPPEAAKLPRKQILDLMNRAGLKLDSERVDLLPYQTFLVFRKPG